MILLFLIFTIVNNSDQHSELAQIFHRKGELQNAIAEYQKAIDLDPEIAEYHYDLATVYHALGQLESAEKEYQIALELDPKFGRIYHNLGEIYRIRGKFNLAIEAYRQALKRSPDDHFTKKRLAHIEHEKRKLLDQEILRHQIAISLEPNNPENYEMIAFAYYRNRQLDDVIKSLKIASHLQPSSDQARKAIEDLLTQKEKSLNSVLRTEIEKLKTDPKEPQIHYTIAIVHLQKGNFPLAEKYFRQTIELAPTADIAWLGLGETLEKMENFEEAKSAFRNAIKFDPNSAEAFRRLGVIEKEIDHLQKAIEIEPNNAETHFHLGEIFHEKKRLKSAMIEFHTAIRIKPDTVLSYFRLAEIYAEIGNESTAIRFYDRFIAIASPRPEFRKQTRSAKSKRSAFGN